MIKILTLFRIVPDYDQVLKEDWKNINHLNTDFTQRMFDAYDEGAIEGALRLKDALVEAGEEAHLTAIGSGSFKDTLLSSLYAAGYDDVIFYESEGVNEETALEKIMADIKSSDYHIIFTGFESGPFGYRMDGPLVAAERACSWYSDVTEVTYADGNILVTVEKENEYVTYKAATPFVCSFGNAVNPVLRLFSLKARLEAQKKEITKKKVSKFSLRKDDVKLEVNTKAKHCHYIEKDNKEIIEFLKKACREGDVK